MFCWGVGFGGFGMWGVSVVVDCGSCLLFGFGFWFEYWVVLVLLLGLGRCIEEVVWVRGVVWGCLGLFWFFSVFVVLVIVIVYGVSDYCLGSLFGYVFYLV